MADGPKKKRSAAKNPEFKSDGRKHTAKTSNPKTGELTKSGKLRKSGQGKRNAKVNQATWRRKLQQSRIKFDDVVKEVFLDAYRKNNLKMRACDAAGVALATVNEHLKNDPDFASAFDQATADWRDFVVQRAIVEIALEGNERRKLDTNGNVIEEWREHPVPLLLAELKRVDHGFREKSTLDIVSGGGVLIAPPDISPADWMELQRIENLTRTNPMLQLEGPTGETLGASKEKIPQTQKVVRG